MIDLARLRILDAVARTGSVTAAAKELHYSQPSVSHHLTRLEQETGAQLLQRIGRGIRLTPSGRLLADRAAEILRREHPDLQLSLIDTHPPEALEMLRAGHVDVALIFRYDESPPEEEGIRLVHVLDDPTYLLTTGGPARLADHRDS